MNSKYEVKYEDSEVLVVYKPAGLASQSGRVGEKDLETELKKYRKQKGEEPVIFTIHRLDKPVEGLLVYAKNRNAAAALNKELTCGVLNKTYRVKVFGEVDCEGEIKGYIKKDGDKALFSFEKKDACYRSSVLKYQLVECLDSKNGIYELLVHLETGRFHQIRASFSAIGHPVMGDRKYGTDESIAISESLGLNNVCLCACAVSFKHPKTHNTINISI